MELMRADGQPVCRCRVATSFDVVFLDADRRIVSLVEALHPWRFAAAKSAASVLELAGGECERLGLAEGDVLSVAA